MKDHNERVNIEKEVTSILERHKLGHLTTIKARSLMLVATGQRKSSTCRLDRLPNQCSIILNTRSINCDGCGHFF